MLIPIRFRFYILISLFISCLLGAIILSSMIQIAVSVPIVDASIAAPSITQGTQKTILDNGLTVLTKEIHTAPVVSVQVWYRVGARNEGAGKNGISHQLEHLMFKGTTTRPIQFGRFFSALGSEFNAYTSYDETAYFNMVESDKLEALLVLEADRMENVVINTEQLDSERRVVISELQGYENSPDYRLTQAVIKAVFPNHAYGFPVGGTKADVEKFTVEEVQNHYQTYYTPDNATLVITGDFSTDAVLPKIRETFGKIPKRSRTAPVVTTKTISSISSISRTTASQSPILLKQPGSAALLEAVYPLPPINHADMPAVDLMNVILTGGRSSRLYQAVVETGLASDVSAAPVALMEAGWYSIFATAAPGYKIAKVDRVLQQALAKFRRAEVSQAELNRAKAQLKTSFLLSNQDISSQAEQLGYSQTIVGDYQYLDRYLAAIEQVSPADIQRVAQIYLDPANRTVGFFEPTTIDDANVPTGHSSRTVENFSPGQPVDPAEVAQYLPAITATQPSSQALPTAITLANGVKVLLLPDASTPMITLNGWIEAGSAFDPKDKAGLASLTADNLMSGTQTQTALALATVLADQGITLSFDAEQEGVSFEGYALNEHLPTLVQTLADMLQQATFPPDQLELTRQQALINLKAELDDPAELGWRMLQQTIYPANHPFRFFTTEATLKAITQSDVVQFYQSHYRPETMVLSLVGSFDSAAVETLLNNALGHWQAQGNRPVLQLPAVATTQAQRISHAIPGKTEAVTYLGCYSEITRQDPRFYPALILNQIVGGDPLASRLGTEIRDRQGLTYDISSSLQVGRHPGIFVIEMQTAPEDVEKAVNSTLALLQQVQNQGVTAAEVETAKRSITSSYSVELANPSHVGLEILINQVNGLSLEEIRQFPQQIEAVTLEQVQQAISKMLHPKNLVIVTVGA